jgi:hypothetical protein
VLEVVGGISRPPMEPTQPNRGLLAAAQRLGRELGLTLEGAGLVGGASDANTTSRYTATLDGLPVGEGAHAPDERVSVSSIAERAALLALLLLEPANRRSLSQAEADYANRWSRPTADSSVDPEFSDLNDRRPAPAGRIGRKEA